jgi:hypothetical protein
MALDAAIMVMPHAASCKVFGWVFLKRTQAALTAEVVNLAIMLAPELRRCFINLHSTNRIIRHDITPLLQTKFIGYCS